MSEPSGRAWCARFSTSKSVADLREPFRTGVSRFIAALELAGAEYTIAATLRPPERAYLMHWCWMIVKTDGENLAQLLASIPPMDGVEIDWTHGGDLAAAREGAKEMFAAYGLAYRPSLTSRHSERRAIDLDVHWNGTLTIRGADGKPVSIATMPRNGNNRDLQAVAAGFGVHKLVSDPPHWSDDGH